MKATKPIPASVVPEAEMFARLAQKLHDLAESRRKVGEAIMKCVNPGRYGTFTVVHVKEHPVRAHKRKEHTYLRSNSIRR